LLSLLTRAIVTFVDTFIIIGLHETGSVSQEGFIDCVNTGVPQANAKVITSGSHVRLQ